MRRVSTIDALFSSLGWTDNDDDVLSRFHGGEVCIGIVFSSEADLSLLERHARQVLERKGRHGIIKPLYLVVM